MHRSSIARTQLITLALVATLAPASAWAVAVPLPGAATAQTVTLPDGPASVRGLADRASVEMFHGQLSYAVPIELPHASGGFAPTVALAYSGALGNGPVGIGWAIAAPAIRRSERKGVPSFTSADELDLTGVADGRLVAASDGSWRVEGRGNAIKVLAGDTGGWVVLGSDGTRYVFGATAEGRQAADDGRTVAWFLESATDLAGQTIVYRYRSDQSQVYLREIDWGPKQSFAALLSYGSRPDVTVSYRSGFAVSTALRLASIEVHAFGEVLRTYQLSYDEQLSLSRLASVHMTGRGGQGAMPDLTFGYGRAPAPALQPLSNSGGWVLNQRGVSLLDVDGDGLADLFQLDSTFRRFRKNLGNGKFGDAQNYTGADPTTASTALLADVDGDAHADLVTIVGGSWRVAHWGGAGWATASAWANSHLVPTSGSDTALVDLNGDGRTDVLTAVTSGLHAWFGGDGTLTAATLPPVSSGDPLVRPGGPNVRFMDVNGDGLGDAVWLTDHLMRTYLGRGDGTFVASTTRAYPWPEVTDYANTFLADVNRDGLVDLLRFESGNLTWYRGLAGFDFCPTPVQIARPESVDRDAVVALADIYGSGALQVVWSSPRGLWALDLAGPVSSAMLTRIDNGLGRVTTLSYSASGVLSAAARAAGAPWASDSALSIPVPLRMSVDPGGGEPVQTTEYTVRDAFWDVAEHRFGGFLTARERQVAAVGNTVEIVYEQGLGDRRVLRGLPLIRRTFDDKGQPLLAQTYTRDTVPIAGVDGPLGRVAILVAETQDHLEGVAQAIVTRTEYSYDADGRVTEERRLGRIDTSGDESTRFSTWASDDGTWVRDKLVTEGIKAADGTVVRTTRHYYGDASAMLPLGQIGTGWRRKSESLLHDATRGDVWRDDEESQYDALGNVIAHFDGVAWRQRIYDDNGLFVTQERATTNGRTLAWSATWDAVLAQPTSVTGPNGDTTYETYDELGRQTSRAHTAGRPYLLISYEWTAPRPRTVTHLYEGDEATMPAYGDWRSGSGWREAIEIANGSGEHILTATRLAADRLLVDKYTLRDERGKTIFRSEPFEWAQADVPAALPAGTAGASFTYDALERTVRTVVATGAARTSQFSAFSVTTTIDGLAPITTRLDGLGRVIHTERVVNNAAESVDADWDAASAITRLRLQNGTVEHDYSYDSLGRLVGTHDPDSGTRTLRYDDANQLVEQINGAGEHVAYEYDDLGRITAIRTADGRAFVYHYDVGKDGTSTGATLGRAAFIEEPTGGVELAYDIEGRVAVSRRVVKGRSLQEQRRYSPAGNVLGVSFDDGFAYDVSYDDAGRPIQVGDFWNAQELDARGAVVRAQFGNGLTESYERDALGQATHLSIAGGERRATLYDVTAVRNATGAITSLTDNDGVGLDHSATFGYDAAGRVTQATIGGSARQYQFGYAWDGLQNLVSRAAAGPKAVGTFPGTYVYGENGASPRQLTRVTANGKDVVMSYDAAGRMTRQGDFAAAYNAFDELVQVLDAAGKPVATHDYGYDGLRTWTQNADGSEQIWLDATVTEKAGKREHTVDVNGRTVAKISYNTSDLPAPATGPLGGGGSDTIGVHLAGALRATTAALPGLFLIAFVGAWLTASRRARVRRRVSRPALVLAGLTTMLMACGAHGPFEAKRSAEMAAPERVYFHQGFAAGPVLFTRSDGSIEEERTYEPFGAPLDAYRGGALGGVLGDVDFGVESRNELNSETDPNTQWTYQGARWMLPQLARWATPDPPTKAPDPKFLYAPWDLNPYAYARANPVIFWDPDGQSWKSFAWGFAKGAVKGAAMAVVFTAAAAVAPVATAVVGGALLVKTGYDLYKARHEIAAVGHRIASGTTTDADHEMFGEVLGGVVGGKVGAKFAGKMLKPAPSGRGGCFVAGTPILTAHGEVPIESVAVGDLVWSHDAESGAEGWKPVLRTVVHEDEPLVAITIRDENDRDETIEATPDHPFWVEGRGWMPAGKLAPLDEVVQADARHGVVVAATAEARTSRVYNFEVESWHSYFVGRDATLVHNNTDDCLGGAGPNKSYGKSAQPHYDEELHRQANAARDQLAADLAKSKHPPATVVGAYSKSTGQVTAAASRGGGLGCAEGVCDGTLGHPPDVQFTTAVRPRTGDPVPVCTNCESTYGRGAFPDPATQYQSDK